MIYSDDVKRLHDSIDNMSSFGEKIGLKINSLAKVFGRKFLISLSFLFFGIFVGLIGNFIKGIFNIKRVK